VITWERFRELFDFGRDIFIYSIGSQLINASQTILLFTDAPAGTGIGGGVEHLPAGLCGAGPGDLPHL
jgi:hypothetical protein